MLGEEGVPYYYTTNLIHVVLARWIQALELAAMFADSEVLTKLHRGIYSIIYKQRQYISIYREQILVCHLVFVELSLVQHTANMRNNVIALAVHCIHFLLQHIIPITISATYQSEKAFPHISMTKLNMESALV